MAIPEPRLAGVVLAAGMGRRFGGPKALADTGEGPWVLRALDTVAGLSERLVVVGAAADRVAALLPEGVAVAENPDYEGGMGGSLVTALTALTAPGERVDAAVIMLVDLPDVRRDTVDRVVAEALAAARSEALSDAERGAVHGTESIEPRVSHQKIADSAGGALPGGSVMHGVRNLLARATYRGKPGHPVVLGSNHFDGIIAAARGDHGARDYLAKHQVLGVECGDLAGGHDVDRLPGGA